MQNQFSWFEKTPLKMTESSLCKELRCDSPAEAIFRPSLAHPMQRCSSINDKWIQDKILKQHGPYSEHKGSEGEFWRPRLKSESRGVQLCGTMRSAWHWPSADSRADGKQKLQEWISILPRLCCNTVCYMKKKHPWKHPENTSQLIFLLVFNSSFKSNIQEIRPTDFPVKWFDDLVLSHSFAPFPSRPPWLLYLALENQDWNEMIRVPMLICLLRSVPPWLR